MIEKAIKYSIENNVSIIIFLFTKFRVSNKKMITENGNNNKINFKKNLKISITIFFDFFFKSPSFCKSDNDLSNKI